MLNLKLVDYVKTAWCAVGLVIGLGAAPVAVVSADTQETTLFYANVMTFYISSTGSGVTEVPINGRTYLYGTLTNQSSDSGGAIYRVATDGSGVETLYQLKSTDGYLPVATLLLGVDGMLYGTTAYGERVGRNTQSGAGTIFKVAADGTGYTTLHVFDALVAKTDQQSGAPYLTNNDGSMGSPVPYTRSWFDGGSFARTSPQQLTEGGDGYVYGIAPVGGANGTGTVFRARHDGSNFQVLHTFSGINYSTGFTNSLSHDGAFPSGALYLDTESGSLFGVTRYGGDSGAGTIYRLQLDGGNFQTIFSFEPSNGQISGFNDTSNCHGGEPVGRPIVANGMLYGVTTKGGNDSANCDGNATGQPTGYGTVFGVALTDIPSSDVVDYNRFVNIHNFDGVNDAGPLGDLVMDADGAFIYGETSESGAAGSSIYTIDTLSSQRDFNLAFSFANSYVNTPSGSFFQGRDGNLYGTAFAGGSCAGGSGAVFQLRKSNSPAQQGYANCINPNAVSSSNSIYGGGGGVMDITLLMMLSMLGLVPPVRRYFVAAGCSKR